MLNIGSSCMHLGFGALRRVNGYPWGCGYTVKDSFRGQI